MITTLTLSPRVTSLRWISLCIGVGAGIICVWAALQTDEQSYFFRAYLFAWMVCLGLSLGSLSIIMLHNIAGGDWARALRYAVVPAALNLPLVALLFIPILLGLRTLYPWAIPENVASNDTLHHRAIYLNPPFFVIRAAIYFILWIALAWTLQRWHRRWEQSGDAVLRSRIRGLSAAGLILYVLTMTHAGIDWVMSRDVEFYSTAFGFVVTVGQNLSAVAFAIVIMGCLPLREQRRSALALYTGPGILNDIGNILLTLVILWTYVSFMEFLVIWMGNSREDNTWFLQRGMGQPSPWRWFGLMLLILHFFIPFCLLLFRATKQYIPSLLIIASVLLVTHILADYWFVAPSGTEAGPHFDLHWLDPVALVAVLGVWVAGYLWLLPTQWVITSAPLVENPQHDGAAAHG